MTADFQVLSEEEAKDAGAVQQALLGGKVVVVQGPDHQPRGVIDPVSRLESLSSHVVVEPGHRIHEVLRAMHDAEARVAVVTRISVTTGRPEVLGVINERDIARAAYVAAKLAA